MDKYSPNSKCPKCGHKSVETRYCDGSNSRCVDFPNLTEEHIDRECCRCGYEWAEKPLDAQEAGK